MVFSRSQFIQLDIKMRFFVVFVTLFAIQAWTSGSVIPIVEEEELFGLQDSILEDINDDFVQLDEDEFALLKVESDPTKCVPYVQDAYKIAVEIRRIYAEKQSLMKKVKEALQKCKAVSSPEQKKKCVQEAKKSVEQQKKNLLKAWNVVKPKAIDMMDKFKKCLA